MWLTCTRSFNRIRIHFLGCVFGVASLLISSDLSHAELFQRKMFLLLQKDSPILQYKKHVLLIAEKRTCAAIKETILGQSAQAVRES
jgi:hypothetical protein